MSCPRVEVDLVKIRRNTQTLVRRLAPRGIGITGVTKAVCGHPAIAQAMLDGGAVGLADARIRNVQRLRAAGLTGPITLIRTPMLSQAEHVVQSCEASYNTEISVISALAAAAIRKGSVHGIVLMVEMGDQRDGIRPEDLADIAQQVMQLSGLALKGIGANFACLNRLAQTALQIAAFCDLANEIEGVCGPFLKIVSGGNSANLPWAFGEHSTGRVNDLRLGEAILLGVEPVSGDQIDGMHSDAFTLVAEVIETDAKKTSAPIVVIDTGAQRLQIVTNRVAPRADDPRDRASGHGHSRAINACRKHIDRSHQRSSRLWNAPFSADGGGRGEIPDELQCVDAGHGRARHRSETVAPSTVATITAPPRQGRPFGAGLTDLAWSSRRSTTKETDH